MCIEHLFYQENEVNKGSQIQIRNRLIEYFQDLHHRHCIPLDKKTISSFWYQRYELENKLFDLIKEKINICEYDYCILCYSAETTGSLSAHQDLFSKPEMNFILNTNCVH